MIRGLAAVGGAERRAVPRWLAAYLALAAIWGLSFLFIKLADRAFAPLQIALGRVALGCVVVCVVAGVGRRRLPRDVGLWLRLMVAAFLMNTAPFTLLAYGEQRITSVTAGLCRFLAQSGLAPVALAAGQLICATAQLTVISLLVTSAPSTLPWSAVLSVVALGAAGTGIAYVLNYAIVRDAGAIVAATVTYVLPIFSTMAGVLLLGERLTPGNVIGAPLIVAGAALAQQRATRGLTSP